MAKSLRLRGPLTRNMVIPANTIAIWMTAPLPFLLINMQETELEKVSLSDMKNLNTVF